MSHVLYGMLISPGRITMLEIARWTEAGGSYRTIQCSYHTPLRGPGEYIGEMSLFNPDGQHTASVRARQATPVLEMTRADLDELLRRQPALAYETARLRSENQGRLSA